VKADDVLVRPLTQDDLDEADRIFRIAFGTFLGVPEPERFTGDADFVRTRWTADPTAVLAAELDGRLVGSNFATNWGSVGFFGPLTVAPDHWDRAIGQRLLDATMEIFASWNTRHTGLFTFAHSTKHVGLYQKYGFWPRFLTAIMSAPVQPDPVPPGATTLSGVPDRDLPGVLRAIRELTDAVYPGLDVSREIDAVLTQKLGDTVLIDDAAGLQAVAVCHVGAGSEAGSGVCYVKFGAVRPGLQAARGFELLLDACRKLAADRGASVLLAGVNAGCDRAWTAMTAHGFRPVMQGVAMDRPDEAGYHTSDSYIIDDWR
jgi:GNAT superfamily N-acetyltransferase